MWLHPEPSEPFAALTAAVWRRWPAYPPYEGVHEVVIPHLTVSEDPIEVDIPLPIKASARAVTLIEQDGGRPLGRPPRVPALPYGSVKSIAGVLSSGYRNDCESCVAPVVFANENAVPS